MDRVLLDCDTHFSDHLPELWQQPVGASTPRVVPNGDRSRLALGDLLFPKPDGTGQGNPKGLGHLIGEGRDADRDAFMAEHGIATAVLQPGFVGLSFHALADPAQRTALAGEYNARAAAACAASALDLRWAVLLSAEDPEWSLAEVGRHRADPALVAAVVRPTGRTPEVRLSDPRLTPLLHTLADERLALFLHGGTGCYQWSPFADAYRDYTMTHAFGHMGEHMVALADLLSREDGLPPELGVVMLESGVGWIPAVVERLASHVRRLSDRALTPTEVFRRQFGVVPDPEEQHARWACEQLGTQSMLFGSDYPHWDTVASAAWRATFDDLCPPDALRDNTLRLIPRLRDAR